MGKLTSKFGKKKVYGIGIVISAIVIISISIVVINTFRLTDEEFIEKAIEYKEVAGNSYALDMLDKKYGYGESSEKTAIHDKIFANDKAKKEKDSYDKVMKDAQDFIDENKKVTTSNLTYENSFGDVYTVKFDINNNGDKYIDYIEFILEAYDSNGKVVESTMCNELNILPNTTHNKSYPMNIPKDSANWGVKIKDIRWGN